MPTAPLTHEALLRTYASYGRPRARWKVGAELERHLLDPSGRPAPYFGAHGVADLLHAHIVDGWRPYREGPHAIALLRDGASITLEPGAQFELSGAPWRTAQEVVTEARAFASALDVHLAAGPYRQVALGYTPVARIDDIGWVPKGRYAVMRTHMAKVGSHGHHMMKGTCATQASFDFSDEGDCARKTGLAIALAPLFTAMFANSPISRGRPNGWQSFRGFVWTQTDAARTGFPEALSRFSYAAWLDYLLDVPMMFTKTGGRWASAGGLSFRRWMDGDAGPGRAPTWDDWDLHLTSVFPEVRVKKQIEVRMADCVPTELVGAFVALFEGLFYCGISLDAAMGVARRFERFGTRDDRFLVACRHGLRGVVGGRPLTTWAEEVVEAARAGLSRCQPADLPLLDPLIRMVEHGVTPADLLLAALRDATDPDALRRLTHPAHDPTATLIGRDTG